ncbi:MAG: hypothetical protein J6X45_04355 [Lachnospiraceae bacterium]|nr:hypothetical protein [Lachnospiraceae bacterium]
MTDEKVLETVEEEDGDVIELQMDEYKSLVEGLTKYKKLYEDTKEQLDKEKANVVDLLGRVEALEDTIKNLEK